MADDPGRHNLYILFFEALPQWELRKIVPCRRGGSPETKCQVEQTLAAFACALLLVLPFAG